MPEDSWDEWGNRIVSGDETLWAVNPREATRRAITKAGRELAKQAHDAALGYASHVGAANQLGSEFYGRHPEFAESDVTRRAVDLAVGTLAQDERFAGLLRSPKARPKVLDRIARIAGESLGWDSRPASPRTEDTSRGNDAGQKFEFDERNAEALGEVLDHEIPGRRRE